MKKKDNGGGQDIGGGNSVASQPPFNSTDDYSTDIAGEGFQTGMMADNNAGSYMNYNFNPSRVAPYGRFSYPRNRNTLRQPRLRSGE